ncbi:uncharacterized protein LOC142528503 [Primulina tabacum]|uniref:uncharacterized protein LOC142528503 n=1 Tax=Primulina tabacum TaxID=48773 RepID=UPI003F5A6EAF
MDGIDRNDSTVDTLIKDGAWDMDLISNNFNPWIAGEILKIPLPTKNYCDTRSSSTIDLCGWMRDKLSKVEFEKFAIQTWAIWKERQNMIHDTNRTSMAKDVSWSLTFLSEFQRAKALDYQEVASHSESANKRWKKPATGTYKLNVDACVNENSNLYSIDGVLRDYQGRLLLGFGKQISQPLSVAHGELLAIREGVKLVYEKKFREVLVVYYSVLAVQAVKAVHENLGYIGACVSDFNLLVQDQFISDIVYEPRLSNNVAHNLAKFASLSPSPFVWLNGEFPRWLVEFVMNDLS